MAFGTSRIFRSTDVGAPQFNNAAGSLNAVLKAVLCTGYGSTPSLGWTVEFESGNVLVVRMKGGTRTFIQFDDTLTGSYTYVAAYSTMSSAFDGTERMPAAGQTACFILKTFTSTNTANVPWTIVGDDCGFYLKHAHRVGSAATVAQLCSLVYFGDYVPFDLRNKWNFCIIGNTSGRGVCIYPHVPSTAPHYVKRNHLFERGATYAGIWSYNSNSYGSMHLTISPTGNYEYLTSNGLFSGIVLHSSPVYIGVMGSSIAVFLGVLPGLYSPIISRIDGAPSTYIPAVYNEFVSEKDGIMMHTFPMQSGWEDYGDRLGNLTFVSLLVGEGFRNV